MLIRIRYTNMDAVDDPEVKLEILKKGAWLNWPLKLPFFQKITPFPTPFRPCIMEN